MTERPDRSQDQPGGEDTQGLIEALEPDQLVAATARPLARRPLSIQIKTGLWALRFGVLALTGLVAYVFVSGL